MPHNKSTRPYADITAEQKVAAVFTFEPLREIDPQILSPSVPVGRRFAYPPLLQFMVAMTARLFGSQRQALIELGKPGVWEQCCHWYCSLVGDALSLPGAPPTPREQDAFVKRFIAEKHMVQRLSEELTEIAIGQAVHQGQFPADTVADFANPDLCSMGLGDGTWQPPYSKVSEKRDETGKLLGYSGSRAKKGQPRVQQHRKRGHIDGKEVDGINNLFMATWTQAGRIILASRPTLKGEGRVAYEMLDHLARRLGKRLHTVVYDGALEGWLVQDLFARHGVLVMTKPKARSSEIGESDGHTACVIGEDDGARRNSPVMLIESPHPGQVSL